MTDALLRRAQHTLAPAQRRDLDAMFALCAADEIANVVPLMHLEAAQGSPGMPPGLWVLRRRGNWGRGVEGMIWAGANLCVVLPMLPQGEEEADAVRAELAAAMVGRLNRPAAMVGEASLTLDLWGRVEPWWGPAREVRGQQLSMRIDGPAVRVSGVEADFSQFDAVRAARMDDYDALLPACVHMFIGEVGYDPMRHGRAAYEDRLKFLVRHGRAFLQYGTVDGRRQVVFKAEVGALGGSVAQIQGVWVHPQWRGKGVARAGLGAVIDAVRANLAPTVSLYVNDFNTTAIAAYRAVGFREVGTFATVMF